MNKTVIKEVNRNNNFWICVIILLCLVYIGSSIYKEKKHSNDILKLKQTLEYNKKIDSMNKISIDSIKAYIDSSKVVF